VTAGLSVEVRELTKRYEGRSENAVDHVSLATE